MDIINPDSLAVTLDNVNEAFFHGPSLSEQQRKGVARWIASRQGKPGSYADMFAPTINDFREGAMLFTGEIVRSRGGMSHILGEEACRALLMLDVADAEVKNALDRARLGISTRLDQVQHIVREPGIYCCSTCTDALWRHLSAEGLNGSEQWLSDGIRTLKSYRDGNGKWRRSFPFYYTLLALSEIDLPSAIEEMRYTAPACQRYLARKSGDDRRSQRRQLLAKKILEK